MDAHPRVRLRAPEGFDAATLYAYSLLQEDVATRVRDAFPFLGSPAGLAAEATVCAQLIDFHPEFAGRAVGVGGD
jgi:hypothetical protein